MLNLSCIICSELFGQTDEVYVTTCGHMFHHNCLNMWLERSKTCPQCRNKCTSRSIYRVYFNLANLDVSRIDVGSLQEQLDNANLLVKMKEMEYKKLETKLQEEKDTQKKCFKTISVLEQKVRQKEFQISSYGEQISVLKNDAQVAAGLRKQNKSLKQQLLLMEGVTAILEAGASDTERLLKNESNSHVLATWVTTLKRELRQCETKKTDLRNVVKLVQNDLRKEIEVKREMEDKISQLESELYQAQEKLRVVDMPCTSSTALNNNVRSLKLEERRATISPTIKENIKRIEESTSPYLNIKSSSVGLAHLLNPKNSSGLKMSKISPIKCASGVSMASGTVRKTTSDLSEKYSIFKKPRLMLGSATSTQSNLVFNGMGGSEKVDPFAQRVEEENTENCRVTATTTRNLNQRVKAGSLRNFNLGK